MLETTTLAALKNIKNKTAEAFVMRDEAEEINV